MGCRPLRVAHGRGANGQGISERNGAECVAETLARSVPESAELVNMGLIKLGVLRAVQTILPLRTTLNLVETARVADIRQRTTISRSTPSRDRKARQDDSV